jgi:hypothetical protein
MKSSLRLPHGVHTTLSKSSCSLLGVAAAPVLAVVGLGAPREQQRLAVRIVRALGAQVAEADVLLLAVELHPVPELGERGRGHAHGVGHVVAHEKRGVPVEGLPIHEAHALGVAQLGSALLFANAEVQTLDDGVDLILRMSLIIGFVYTIFEALRDITNVELAGTQSLNLYGVFIS